MADVVLFGTGDFARVARIYLDDDSPHEVAAYTVHGEPRFTLQIDRSTGFDGIVGSYAYARLDDDRIAVVDLTAGTVVDTTAEPMSLMPIALVPST